MAFQPVVNAASINMIYTLNGITVQNVFYALHTGPYLLSNLQSLANNVDLAWAGSFAPDQPIEVAYIKTEVRGLTLENDLVAESSASAGLGTHIGAALPNNVSFAIKKISGLTGRSARGRTYWVGVPRTELNSADENLLKSSYAGTIVTDIDLIRIAIDGVGLWSAVLVSRFANKVKRPTGVTFPWIGTVNVDLRVDTQRSRLPA